MSDTITTPPPTPPAPIAASEPCGPDLEAAFDTDYMNTVARLQGELPASYLGYIYPATEEDRLVIDFAAAFRELGQLTSRTHDLRLLSLRARFELLNGDLPAFASTLQRTAGLVETYWEEVFPRAEGGTMDLRRNELAALDTPLVAFALQYAPVCENRRIGVITLRALMYAQGKAKPRTGEAAPSESALVEALKAADEDEIGPAREAVAAAREAVAQIRAKWAASDDETPPLDKLQDALNGVQNLLDLGRAGPAPTLVERATSAIGSLLGGKPAAGASSGGITSDAEAGAALKALAGYFARSEPSSPALPLIDQAVDLRGKSFFEAIQALLPKQAEQAAFKIGGHSIFDLALSRAAAVKSERGAGGADEPASKTWTVGSRQQAISVMGEVIAFYKVHEPSSPIPWLLERASGLAERDFMSLLTDVLPKAALRDAGQT